MQKIHVFVLDAWINDYQLNEYFWHVYVYLFRVHLPLPNLWFEEEKKNSKRK